MGIRYSYFDYLRYPYVVMMRNEFAKQTEVAFECQGNTYSNVLAYYGMEVGRRCDLLPWRHPF